MALQFLTPFPTRQDSVENLDKVYGPRFRTEKLVTLPFEQRRPRLCGPSSLEFDIRECHKTRPKFHFLTKIEIKMTHLVVFLFCY